METEESSPHVLESTKQVAKQALVICENRFELLLVELQEERDRVIRAVLLSFGLAVFGLLAGVALTVIIAVAFWARSPIVALLILAAIYAGIAGIFYLELMKLRRAWESFSDTLAEFKKDRECLEKSLH